MEENTVIPVASAPASASVPTPSSALSTLSAYLTTRYQKMLEIIIGSFQVVPEYNYLAVIMITEVNTLEKQAYFCEQFTRFKPDGIFYYPCNMAEFWNALAAYRQKYPLSSDPSS
jgi:hypothetical protein